MSVERLPQVVPSERCLRCDVCCRFPEKESPLRPYFTDEEIAWAVARGVPAAAFPDHAGSRIDLVPHPQGEGYICPAFDVTTSRCTIYDVRPFDCRLYPFALMHPPKGDGLLLGWDRLCPYLREEAEPMAPVALSAEIAQRLHQSDARNLLARHPALVGGFQESVWVLEPLRPPIDSIIPAIPDEWRALQGFLEKSVDADLSARHAATLAMWGPLISLSWMKLTRGFALVAEQAGGYFAPVPPLPDSGGHFAAVCVELLERLDQLNGGSASTRIEGLGVAQCRLLEAAGLTCRPQGEDYLYDRRALAELRGDRYKSQRWSCNQAERRWRPRYGPYQPERDLAGCLRLFAVWRRLKERILSADGYATALLADSFYAHWQALAHAGEWGLTARVVQIDGELCAYAVGAPLNDDAMVIFHEVADPRRPGLGPWLFREWCREFTDYSLINAMDDSELAALRTVKVRYRPIRTAASFQAVSSPQ
jgi:hypothetical protein